MPVAWVFCVICLWISTYGPAAPLWATERLPNIVYILADDLGYGDVSCNNPDSKIDTPHIDRLAAEGLRFTDAHTPSAVCTPTRYGLLTGRYCWRTRLKYRVLDGFDPPLIEPNQVTVASLLREAGYRTACIGKWHLGMQWTDKEGQALPAVPLERRQPPRAGQEVDFEIPVRGGPTAVGFDEYFGISASLNMSPFAYLRDDRPELLPTIHSPATRTDFIVVDAGMRSPEFTIAGVMPRLTGEAIAFLQRCAPAARRTDSQRQPFFLYFPLTAPHLPVVPNEEFRGASQAGTYGDFVAEVDATVAAIDQWLELLQLREDTLVIVTSDNGGLYHWWPAQETDDVAGYSPSARGLAMREIGHQGNAHLRGTKADIWEGGHRVPFIARWPGAIQPGVTDALIELTDLLATCADIVGVDLPDGAGPDSISMLPVLQGAPPTARKRDFAVHHSLWGDFAIRQGPWKMMPRRGSGGFSKPREVEPQPGEPIGQLYHLGDDPSETKNLWNERPEIVSMLTERLQQIMGN